jgi:hypothetical protein
LRGSKAKTEKQTKRAASDRPHKEGVLFEGAGLEAGKWLFNTAICFESRRKNGAPKSCPFRDAKNAQKDLSKVSFERRKKRQSRKNKNPKRKKETDLENNNRKSRLAGEKAGRKSRGTLQARALRRASTRKENPFFAQAKNEKCERTRFFSPLAPSESEEVREVVRIAKEKKRFFALCV